MHKYVFRGGRPHDPVAMFKGLLLKEIRQIPSRRKLAEFLKSKEGRYWVEKFGFERPPCHDSFSEFIKRVGAKAFKRIFDELVKRISQLGLSIEMIAVDSTLIKAYSRFYKNKQPSDPDAEWGYNPNNQGWVFGYKVHIAADAELELPVAFTVTPASRYDSTEYRNILDNLSRRGIKFEYVLADAGYDTKDNYYFTSKIYKATPIIAMNRRNLKKGHKRDFEKELPVSRDSTLWSNIYRKRPAVERVFSRAKEDLCLKLIRVRRLERVRVHVAITLSAMLIVALTALKTGREELMNSLGAFRF